MFPDEQKIISEADAWYQKWLKALPKYGKDQSYWNKILEIADAATGDLAHAVMFRRVKELEKEWSHLTGN